MSIFLRATLFVGLIVAVFRFASGASLVAMETARLALVGAVIVTLVVTIVTIYGAASGASWYTRADVMRVQAEQPAKEVEE